METEPITPTEAQVRSTVDSFWRTIPPVWHTLRGHLHEIVTEQDMVTVEQFHILRHIRNGAVNASELAEIKQISRPAISQALDVLAGKGMIERRVNRLDRRYHTLVLTEAGQSLIDAIFERNRTWMAARLEALSPEALDQIRRGLDALAQAFLPPSQE